METTNFYFETVKLNNMNTTMGKKDDAMYRLADLLKQNGARLSSKKIIAGFDGFVDSIVKVIKEKPVNKPTVYFKTKSAFGNYILGKEGSSFSIEMEERNIKAGGNMPIMANALGCLGVQVNCIGAMGYPQLHPAFKTLSPNCRLHSFADPGLSTALEFSDGKIILGVMNTLNVSGWPVIKERIGSKAIGRLYKESDMFCIVNWAEIDASSGIWQGLFKEVLSSQKNLARRPAFFDLSDCSKRSSESMEEMLALLRQFSSQSDVILGLNQNEAISVHRVLYGKGNDKDLSALGKKIFARLSVRTLLLHSSRQAVAINNEGVYTCSSFFMKDPKVSTGAGDNFNAGFCAAQLMQLDLASSLILANAVSGLYIRTGTSPNLKAVIDFLETPVKAGH